MQEEKEQSQCSEQTLQKQEEIKELGNMRPKNNIQIVSIIGQIEGHNTAASGAKTTKYEHVLPLLAKLPIDPKVAQCAGPANQGHKI